MAETGQQLQQRGREADPLLGQQSILRRVQAGLEGPRLGAALRRWLSSRHATSSEDEPAQPDLEAGTLHGSGPEQHALQHTASTPGSVETGMPAEGEEIQAASSSCQGHSTATASCTADDAVPGSPHSARAVMNKVLAAAGRLPRSSSGNANPTCLICLEPLTAEDFESGEAIQLDCQCRGEMAMRHHSCAVKWARVKGDTTCDICKQPVRNLPPVTPRAATEASAGSPFAELDNTHPHGLHGTLVTEQMPSNADVVFDCIRIAWISIIICILFFDMNLASALWTGIITGLAYSLFLRALYHSQLAALQHEAVLAAQGQADAASPSGGSPGTGRAVDIAVAEDAQVNPGQRPAASPAAAPQQVANPTTLVV